jgi:hypothetical protein
MFLGKNINVIIAINISLKYIIICKLFLKTKIAIMFEIPIKTPYIILFNLFNKPDNNPENI